MQAILLATGETEKLRPLTSVIASPLLPVANRPVMSYAIEMLSRQGIKHMLVSLCHLAGQVESHYGSGQRWGVKLEYVLQRDALGSAGALRWAKKLIDGTFLVLPGDILLDLDIAAAKQIHIEKKAAATVIVHPSVEQTSRRLSTDSDGRMTGLCSGDSLDLSLCVTGAYIFDPQVLDFIPARTCFDIHSHLIPALLEAGLPVFTYQTSCYWNALNTFQDHYEAQLAFLYGARGNSPSFGGDSSHQYPAFPGRQIGDGIWSGRNTLLHPSVKLTPPVLIGEDCQIRSGAELGPDVIIGNRVVVDAEATLRRSIVLDQTYIGRLLNVENRLVNRQMVVDLASAGDLWVTDPFLLSETDRAEPGTFLLRLLDLLAGLLFFLLALPVFLLLGFVLWVTTGRVFERLPRLRGRDQRRGVSPVGGPQTFDLLNFSTPSDTVFSRWQKRLEFHRLPELLNVVRGDLRLVGGMPFSPQDAERVGELMQQMDSRFRPGITGLWYVQTEAGSGLEEIFITDAYYAATRNWREDLKVLWQTPAAWFRRVRKQLSNHS